MPILFSRWAAPLAGAMLLTAFLFPPASTLATCEAAETALEGPQLFPLEPGPGSLAESKRILALPWPATIRPQADASAVASRLEEPAPVATPWPARQPAGPFELLACEPASRSQHLESVAREADMHTRQAFQLAGRGAYFAAREKCLLALRLLAQALDGEHRTTVHSRTLATALTTLKEAEDFIPAASQLEADLDLPAIIAGHCTPVLQGTPADGLTPSLAMQSYFAFAQEQLAIAAGRELAGSMALYGLGKLHAALAKQQTDLVRAAGPKAVAFCQASLLVDPRNYLASNELGVLLAQAGRYEDARVALEHSVSISRQWETWQSLAKVYRQLGQAQRAHLGEQQSEAAQRALRAQRSGHPSATAAQVRWVDPKTLAQVPVPPTDRQKGQEK